MAQGLQFWIKGWSGSISVTDGSDTETITPTDAASPLQTMISLASQCQATFGGTWSASVTSDFFLTLTSSGAGTWSATFGGTCDSLTGFSASYSSVSTITASSIATGAFYPYSDGLGLLYALDERVPTNQGVQAYSSAFFFNTPGDNLRRPAVSFSCLRAKSLEFIEAIDSLGTPAKVDLWDDTTPRTYYLGNIRTSERAAIDGWTEFSLEVVR
jgi:hypothetical protein